MKFYKCYETERRKYKTERTQKMRQGAETEIMNEGRRARVQDLPKNWTDSQNHYLHGNKAHHLASLAIWESQHGESWKEERKRHHVLFCRDDCTVIISPLCFTDIIYAVYDQSLSLHLSTVDMERLPFHVGFLTIQPSSAHLGSGRGDNSLSREAHTSTSSSYSGGTTSCSKAS